MSVALGIVLGAVVAILFLASTPMFLGRLVKASPELSMASAVIFFGTKALAAAVVLLLLFDVGGMADHVSPPAFGLAAVAASVVWTTVTLMRFRQDRTPLYDLDDDQ